MARLNEAYRTDALVAEDGVLYDTLGSVGPTALTKSGIAAGFKQAAINVGAEVIYDCPAQWLAEAFSGGGGDDTAGGRTYGRDKGGGGGRAATCLPRPHREDFGGRAGETSYHELSLEGCKTEGRCGLEGSPKHLSLMKI